MRGFAVASGSGVSVGPGVSVCAGRSVKVGIGVEPAVLVADISVNVDVGSAIVSTGVLTCAVMVNSNGVIYPCEQARIANSQVKAAMSNLIRLALDLVFCNASVPGSNGLPAFL